jgi:hypothetical protein
VPVSLEYSHIIPTWLPGIIVCWILVFPFVVCYFPPELAGWVCHWKWKCPCLFRNFRGWGLLSLSEGSCQNYCVIAVTINALHIYILPAYGSSAQFLFVAFCFLPSVNLAYCSRRPFFCTKQFHTLSFDLFPGFLTGLFPLRLSPSIWYD